MDQSTVAGDRKEIPQGPAAQDVISTFIFVRVSRWNLQRLHAGRKHISRELWAPAKVCSVFPSRGCISKPHLFNPPCLDLPVSTSPHLQCAADMVAAANAELYTPFPHSMLIEDGVQSSEEGSTSDIHSPVFESVYPPDGKHSPTSSQS